MPEWSQGSRENFLNKSRRKDIFFARLHIVGSNMPIPAFFLKKDKNKNKYLLKIGKWGNSLNHFFIPELTRSNHVAALGTFSTWLVKCSYDNGPDPSETHFEVGAHFWGLFLCSAHFISQCGDSGGIRSFSSWYISRYKELS